MQFKHILLAAAMLCLTGAQAQQKRPQRQTQQAKQTQQKQQLPQQQQQQQALGQFPPIPADKQVRIGRLDNGLTYYIRANKLPENRADFYIVQRVGSILEEENQRGLAHFLEHMAFHGSKHFPEDSNGPSIISYLETIGVKFGQNLNAYTGMDQTVYNISDVPTNRRGAIDSCLLILHDWSNSLFLRDKDIDKERKVIHEEWRTRRSASSRMIDSIAPVVLAGSKYANRMPIGLMSVVDHFEPKALRDYYHKWYRPDLQGIVIVGDIDPDAVEKQVKQLFGAIPKPKNPAERVYEKVPNNDEPAVTVVADKEQPRPYFMILYKRDALLAKQKSVIDYLVYNFAIDMINRMLGDRFEEMLQSENPPFAYAYAMNGSIFGIATKDAYQMISIPKPENVDTALLTMLREAKRARDYGFTETEFQRAKADWMSDLEKLYNERDKQKNSYYVQQYVDHFLENEPIPSTEDYYRLMKDIIPSVPLAAINQLAEELIFEKNRAVVLIGNEEQRPSYPTPARIREIIASVDRERLEPYADKAINEPLISTLPTKGKVAKEEKLPGDISLWTLSNGARVAIKKTDFKQDEILLAGFAYGGRSLMDTKHTADFKLLNHVATVGGLGRFNEADMKKVLAGKNADLSLSVGEYNQSVGGSSSVRDLETMLQLLYLTFTDVRRDETAFRSYTNRMKGIVTTLINNPNYAFSDSLSSAMYPGKPIALSPTPTDFDEVDYDAILAFYRARTANAADYTFTFVGNVDESTLRPLVEQYIASLPAPAGAPSATFKKDFLPRRRGSFTNNFTRELETPKATTTIVYSGDMAFTTDNVILLSALEQLFNMEFVDKIREKLGGTYGVGVRSEAQRLPSEGFTLRFHYDCDPGRRAELTEAMNAITNRMRSEGPDPVMLRKVQEFMLKQHADNLKENSHTLLTTWRRVVFGIDLNADYEAKVKALTVDSLRAFADQLLSQGNRVEVSMSSK